MKYKSLIATKADVTGRVITGIASVFGNRDDYGDIVCNGSFSKTLMENRKRLRHLWQHNTFDPPIAAIRDIKEVDRTDLPEQTQIAYPEATGGLMVAREYLESSFADSVFQGIKAGAINEMSFMYEIVKADFRQAANDLETDALYLRELKLFETSDVNWGANDATTASKSLLENAIQAGKVWVALHSDNTKEGRVLSTANVNKLKGAISQLEDILLSSEPLDTNTDEPKSAASSVNEALEKKAIFDTIKTRIRIAQLEMAENL